MFSFFRSCFVVVVALRDGDDAQPRRSDVTRVSSLPLISPMALTGTIVFLLYLRLCLCGDLRPCSNRILVHRVCLLLAALRVVLFALLCFALRCALLSSCWHSRTQQQQQQKTFSVMEECPAGLTGLTALAFSFRCVAFPQ